MSAENDKLQQQLERLGPYLHPDRWDGHTFGQGELSQEQRWIKTPRTLHGFVRDELTDYLNGPPDGRFALQTYRAGDTFNVDNYDNGTIVAFNEESINTTFVGNPIDLEGVAPAPVNALLPATKVLKVPSTIRAEFGPLANISYNQGLFWGVVARSSKRSPASVVVVSPGNISQESGQAVVTKVSKRHIGSFAIGAVHHTHFRGAEWIVRMNRLEVCSNGTPEKAKHLTFAAFRRFATHSGMA